MNTSFSPLLTDWYNQNKRDLPWRKTDNPYLIWLSEIILQQTRVVQGLPYYEKFVANFPTINDLANANEETVLKLWQGLGYYSRARNLHFTAKTVVENLNGIFPNTYKDLIKLKGIGTYTASAIASFSNNEAVSVVDGNVYRVLARKFGIYTPINSTEGEKEFKQLANSLLDAKNAAEHNQAIMEFGALWCTPKKPNCLFCPFNNTCKAYNNNTIHELPVKIKKTKIRKKLFYFFIIKLPNNKTLIQKRTLKGIWQHLYQFPLFESEEEKTLQEIITFFKTLLDTPIDQVKIKLIKKSEKPHKLSHQHIHSIFYELELDNIPEQKEYLKINTSEFEKYPIPVLISNFMKEYSFE